MHDINPHHEADSDRGPSVVGDSTAFARLWVTVQPAVSTLIAASGIRRQDADDVLQEVALKVARDFSRYDRERPFMPWVMTITRNCIVDQIRRRQRDRHCFDAETIERLSTACEQMSGDEHDRKAALSECLHEVETKSRRLLEMRYDEGLDGAKIASQMKMTPNAVYLVLSRTRAALADCIKRRIASAEDIR